ncbi:TPA: hypothetical protein L4746_001206 [Pseudomonas aeruginosa]|nr:hypothetical protein [Pseudomonas aeruginosa]HBO6264164.1 hypothetical protein [Pseudomonas aeruginosa]HBO6271126.1 hypothetical protein [Pseudomonas aeruginosa]HBO6289386.1 hypothetical protein [Pseudomonas aeruginosa]HBO6344822.1 hypothetical protein [Pseudomonas aeruginosa]
MIYQTYRGYAFTAVQAAKKRLTSMAGIDSVFTAVQAAKKMQPGLTPLLLDVHCRTGS